jgi:hypothetical protein
MKTTANYGLKKPEGTDVVDIQNFNDNADTIDTQLKKINDNAGALSSLNTTAKNTLVAAINEVFQSGADVKSGTISAVNNKGASLDDDATWDDIVAAINAIARGQGNAVESQVLSGATFSNADGIKRTGTMPNKGAITITPSGSAQTIPAGYHNGQGKVSAVTVPVANVLSGTTIAGQAGTMPNKGAVTITPGAADKTIEKGYHNGNGKVKGEPNLTADNIKHGETIFGITGAYISNVWVTANDLNVARGWLTGCGTQLAGLSFGGSTSNLTGDSVSTTEKFNGISWSTTGNLIAAKEKLAGCGTQSAGLDFGGTDSSGTVLAATEKFNGTSWSTTGDLATQRFGLAGCGTQSAGLSFGGYYNANGVQTITEKFNGSTWSTIGNLNSARYYLGGCGTQSAGLSFGGENVSSSYSSVTELFNGTSWTNGSALNAIRYGLAGCGTQSAGLSFGGYNIVEKFNGSIWVTTGGLNTARYYIGGSGTQSAGLSFGGYYNGALATTEKFND